MFLKAQILERLLSGVNRYFKVNLFARQTQNLVQFHSGGDDYNPPTDAEGLGGSIGENPANGFIFAWRDSIARKCAPGEKRIYSVKSDGTLAGEIYLKNDGVIEVNNTSDLKIVVNGKVSIKSTGETTLEATTVNLGGSGGAFVLTENSIIKDGNGVTCSITSNTTKTKAK